MDNLTMKLAVIALTGWIPVFILTQLGADTDAVTLLVSVLAVIFII